MQRVQRVEVKLVTVGKRPTVGTGKVELVSEVHHFTVKSS